MIAGGQMTKILGGVAAASLLGLVIVFNLLLSSKEANGQLTADLETAVETNEASRELIVIQQKNIVGLQVQFEAEQARAATFTDAVVASQVELERSKHDHAIELAGIRDSLAPAERVCAVERVPDAYFVGLRRNGDSDTDGVR